MLTGRSPRVGEHVAGVVELVDGGEELHGALAHVVREGVDRQLAECVAQPRRRTRVRRDRDVCAPVVGDHGAESLGRERGARRACDPGVDHVRRLPRDMDRAERRGARHASALPDVQRPAVVADDVDHGDRSVDDGRGRDRRAGRRGEKRELGTRGADLGERRGGGGTERDERGAERVRARLGIAHDVSGVGERQQDRVARRLAHVAGAGEVREAQPRAPVLRGAAVVGAQRLEDAHDALGGVRPLTRHLLEY